MGAPPGAWAWASTLTLTLTAAAAQSPRPERVVAVAAISDDFDPATLDAFTRETGVRLALDAFATAQALEAALVGGRYDVATLSAQGWRKRRKPAGWRGSIRRRFRRWRRSIRRWRGSRRGAPFLWSPYGLAYDARRAKERLGERALDSWEVAFRPDTLRAFADCGVALPDDPQAMTAAAALAAKVDPHSRRAADLRRAFDRLPLSRGGVKTFAPGAAIGADLAAGDLASR
ncbi:MAG: hypothetical protein HZY79_02540 [Rhodoblastus sp.]|nr:MAG: hypothetical protein HZY79_02540 [Rhodoblastus sp.]